MESSQSSLLGKLGTLCALQLIDHNKCFKNSHTRSCSLRRQQRPTIRQRNQLRDRASTTRRFHDPPVDDFGRALQHCFQLVHRACAVKLPQVTIDRWRWWELKFDAFAACWSRCAVVVGSSSSGVLAGSNICIKHRSIEDLEDSFGLVGIGIMAGLENSREAEVAYIE